MFHKPFGGGGGTTDADRLCVLKPFRLDVFGASDEVGVGVDLAALREQDLSVAALFSRYENDDIVFLSESADVTETISHLSADSIEILKSQSFVICQHIFRHGFDGVHPLSNQVNNLTESLKRHGGLRIERYVLRKVESFHVFQFFHNDGLPFRLSHEAHNLGMSVLSVDNNLRVVIAVILEFLIDTSLKTEHNRASGVDDGKRVALRLLIGGWWLAMCPEEDFGIVEVLHLLMLDGDESE